MDLSLHPGLTYCAWLAADHFTIADFNVACVLSPSRTPSLDMERHAPTAAWLERCYSRPEAKAVRARFGYLRG